VKDMAVSGGRLYIGGTFKTVNGVTRTALAAADPVPGASTTTSTWGHHSVSVTDWATTRFQQQCASVFDTYMRDVDISPDGGYFVVGTTGAHGGGALWV